MKLAPLALLLLPSIAFACPVLNGEFLCTESSEAVQISTSKSGAAAKYELKVTKLENLAEARQESLHTGRGNALAATGQAVAKCAGELELFVYEADAETGKAVVTFYFLDPRNNLHRGRSFVKPESGEPLDHSSEICRRTKH